MARPRRLRYKLMLGLGLVVGSVALLVGGTLYGIRAYNAHGQDDRAEDGRAATRQPSSSRRSKGRPPNTADPSSPNRSRPSACSSAMLRETNAETVADGLDPDGGDQETGLIAQLDAELNQLQAAVGPRPKPDRSRRAAHPSRSATTRRPAATTRTPAAAPSTSGSPSSTTSRPASASRTGRSARACGSSASRPCWAVVLVLTLLYYFRVWMFAPIRQLQAGVQRVHGGDFDHPIALHSGDELQELADEFNAMTARLAAIYADLARQVNERQPATRPQRADGVGRVPRRRRRPRDQQPARQHPVLLRGAGAAAAGSPGRDASRQRRRPPADAEVLTRYLKMIQQEALRCKDITQKLLDFSRTGERKREPTDLAGLVRGVLEVARHLPNCRGKNIAFEPTGYIVAPVNAQDLKSVILNLVVNALDSMDDGGQAGDHARHDRRATPRWSFADTGCGMAPEVLQNIFEPFFTKSRTGKGTGLGLFISHQIIDQHGGTIEAASPGPGRGSTFTVRVPLPRGGRAASPARPRRNRPMLPFPGCARGSVRVGASRL